MVKVVGIKFKTGGKLYYFAPKNGDVYERNMPVVVETAKGIEYAWVAYPEREVDESEIVSPLKPVVRIATQKDTEFYKACEAKKPQAMQICKEKIVKHGLEMKLVDCEYAFDGSKIVFFFTSASRVDFRELVKDLAASLHSRIELRQVGTRDETKYLGGIAPCGRVCCCAGNMPEFKKVSVKMAKAQGLSLNPGKISGLCGRLMCCLGYEIEHYTESAKLLPKVGSEVGTPEGKAVVASLNMLKMQVRVKIDDKNGGWIFKDYPASELRYKKQEIKAPEKDEDEMEEEALEE
jgi:cell fate regulator YaaT (PSP1 superfamily)